MHRDGGDTRSYQRMIRADQRLRGCIGFIAFIVLLALAFLFLWLTLK